MPCIIATNVHVADGLSKGTYSHLKLVEKLEAVPPEENTNIGDVNRLWLKFAGSSRIDQITKKLATKYMQDKKISKDWVPIGRSSASIYLKNNRTITAKRNHFPLTSACAVTLLKSQGGTCDSTVYFYEKSLRQHLAYVAFPRVINLEGLFIVLPTQDRVFYHGQKILLLQHHCELN
ncbi:ATP-dependent DNA helicase [Trichonephila clavata]|uniref:ATP-dependent DNA helicase n=1 Tax=Trichonephila clavata TaxID=2740835 RepID=A0A8X6H5L9_TRICU|nr:ATP-dependent DNA helicase [Trichonephila clavata]